jgi:hypothetical protein
MNKQDCFVIMPFSQTTNEHTQDYWTRHYEKFLKPIIEENGFYEVHRSKALSGDILDQIIRSLVASQLVVADLTDANPNVYWELGVRQSFKNGTITIAEYGTSLPFDLGGKGTLFYYTKDHIKNNDFIKDFQEAIKQISANQSPPDSQVLETISGRGTFFEVIQRDEAIRRVNGLIEETKENKKLLDIMIEAIRKEQKAPFGHCSFQYCSLELLLTQRYLEDSELYADARHLYFVILATNSAISQHRENWDRLKKFFEFGMEELGDKIDNFSEKLQVVIENLERIR